MIQVIQRALDIFEFLAEEPHKSRSLSEISNAIGIQPSTCANIVKTLVQRGYLVKSQNQKAYFLGGQWHQVISRELYYDKLINVSRQELESLGQRINENAFVAVLEKNQRKILVKKDSTQQVQAYTPDLKNAYDTSTGRLLVALKTDEELKQFIDMYGLPEEQVWSGMSDQNVFIKEIEKIRKSGYAIIEDSGQIIGFAAPIILNEKVIAALSVYMPAFRYSEDIHNLFVDQGLQTARRISEMLKL